MSARFYARKVFHTAMLVVSALSLSVVLGACGKDDSGAKKAAKWLKKDSQYNPPNGEWITTSVHLDKNGRIVMDVLVPIKEQVMLIKTRTRIEQARIVMLACPPKNSEFWGMIEKDRELWVNLTARTDTSMDTTLQGATCRH
ncbi:MAG: hypothetical protein HON02_01325 [Rhodospirillaceae bacterium]|nr:hypothetical protein [Rhodospirillaceae bacterium]